MQARNHEASKELKKLISGKFHTADAKKLIEQGANPNTTNSAGNSLAHLIVKILLKNHNEHGRNKYYSILNELVRMYGANINLKNKKGLTPLTLLQHGNYYIKDLVTLSRLGATPSKSARPGLFFSAEIYNSNNTNLKKLGEGNFANVYKSQLNNSDIAIKECKLKDNFYTASYYREKQALAKFTALQEKNKKQMHIIKLYGCIEESNTIKSLITEYIPNSDLFHHVWNSNLSLGIKTQIAYDISTAMSYIHHYNYVHCDIKLENILLDHSFHAYLGDFGFAMPLRDAKNMKGALGTPPYIAPELWEVVSNYSSKSDIFSFGVLTFILATEKEYYYDYLDSKDRDYSKKEMHLCQEGILPSIPNDCPRFFSTLCRKTLNPKAELRPEASEIKEELGRVRKNISAHI
jgi:tRNA A-37 threonylcarbamoyl transferase component Bud32